MKIIVGLGNPGMQYQDTKHNIGFMTVDDFAFRHGQNFNQQKNEAIYFDMHLNGEKILVVKPQTFMNESGRSIIKFADFYGVDNKDIVVVYDDLDLETGKVRLRQKGGAGGHNGIKSLIQHLGGQDFKRVRIGIGRPYPDQAVVSHVLSPFSKEDEPAVKEAIYHASDALDYFLAGNSFEDTMTNFNK